MMMPKNRVLLAVVLKRHRIIIYTGVMNFCRAHESVCEESVSRATYYRAPQHRTQSSLTKWSIYSDCLYLYMWMCRYMSHMSCIKITISVNLPVGPNSAVHSVRIYCWITPLANWQLFWEWEWSLADSWMVVVFFGTKTIPIILNMRKRSLCSADGESLISVGYAKSKARSHWTTVERERCFFEQRK